MSLPVRFSAEAASELDDAAAWYDDQRPGLGDTFIDAVEVTLALIADWPGAGAPVAELPADLDVRRAPVVRFPYHVAYVATDDHVRVLAVAHDRRLPGYWNPRLSR